MTNKNKRGVCDYCHAGPCEVKENPANSGGVKWLCKECWEIMQGSYP